MSAAALRRARLADGIIADSSRGVLVTGLAQVRYLTGFTGSHATLCGSSTGWLLITDSRYAIQVARECPDLSVMIERASFHAGCQWLSERGVRDLFVEESLAAIDFVAAGRIFTSVTPDLSFLTQLRSVKDSVEIALVAQAGSITATVLTDWAHDISVGMTERQIARELESRFISAGASGVAFESIVAAGENSAIPHHRPTDRPLCVGDLLVIDCGAKVDGYRADMTRTYIVAAQPQDWQLQAHEAVTAAQQQGCDSLRPGISAVEIDEAVRRVIDESGFGKEFSHGTGHGVGLDIHEWPLLVPRGTGTIRAGMTLTVEPGVYLEGKGGVRIEDTVLVTEGAPHILTETDRALVRIG